MKKTLTRGFLAVLPAVLLLAACGPTTPHSETINRLQADALESDLAWELLSSLTTDVGPRMPGTRGDALGVSWAEAEFKRLGFDRVRKERVTFPLWRRGFEQARVVLPRVQDFAVTALGGSPGTGGIVSAEVVYFPDLAMLEAAAPGSLDGKIAFISERMERTRSGRGYGRAVAGRTEGPYVAAEKGARALIIRSVGTDNDRLPHTGQISTSRTGPAVPSAAISNPDADLLVAMLESDERVRMELRLDVGYTGEEAESYNVIGEFDGREDNGEYVMIGAHLDSWDLGTGAHDDGAGVAITMAAARLVANLPERPRRGIRVVLFANEEQGIFGGKAYARAHAGDLASHVIGAEADLGAGRIYQFRSRVRPEAEDAMDELARYLAPLNIPRQLDRPASGGADIGQMRAIGLPVVDLNHDASRYFDLHHTANDVLAQVDPEDIAFNVAAYVTFVYFTAETDVVFGPVETTE
ncbi:MAG: M28 family peptidase [Xanthomonadales bacterium]|jgi:Zn-dependent M28 family amino/carboxypeptidase|nr:M28 family peptidase [Xanthomonadales bacterium]